MIFKELYINESIVNDEDTLLTHIAIDYINQSKQEYLFEKYGIYNGCKELVNFILNKIKNKYKNNYTFITNIKKSELKDYENVFYEEIELVISNTQNASNGGYIVSDKNKLNKNNLFDIIKFKFNINHKNFIQDLRSLLYHELTHAYNDYCLVLTNKDNLYKSLNKSNYNNFITGKSSYDNIKQIISDVLYHINKIEQHAYIGELQSELENNADIIHGPQEALNIIKKSVIYKNILTSREIIYGLTDDSYSKEVQEKIYDVYRELNQCNWTNNKIKKKLINQIDKYLNKVDKIIPKMCLDFLNNNMKEIYEEHNRKIVSLTNYIKQNE